jgi:hypothetical protein
MRAYIRQSARFRPGHLDESEHLNPGSASLLIGVFRSANREIGAPGGPFRILVARGNGAPEKLDLAELRTYSFSKRRRMNFQWEIHEN